MQTLTTPTAARATGCRPRSEIVAQGLPELLAAFRAREDLRRRTAAPVELVAAADRLEHARMAVRAAC